MSDAVDRLSVPQPHDCDTTDLRPGNPGVEVGQVWKRNPPGRERLRIDRVWQGYVSDHPELWTVRAQPLHGGPYVLTSPHDIAENYFRERDGEATHEEMMDSARRLLGDDL